VFYYKNNICLCKFKGEQSDLLTCHSCESQISYLSCKLGTAVVLLYTLWNSSARYLPFYIFMPDDDCYGCKHVTVCKVNIFVQAVVLTEIVCMCRSGNSALSSSEMKIN